MSKELEALKRITNEISNYKLHGIDDENWLGIQDLLKDTDILEKALIPPTADEVCRLIERDIKGEARYSHGQFYIDNEKVDDLLFGAFGAKTVIAIGKFYEELEK